MRRPRRRRVRETPDDGASCATTTGARARASDAGFFCARARAARRRRGASTARGGARPRAAGEQPNVRSTDALARTRRRGGEAERAGARAEASTSFSLFALSPSAVVRGKKRASDASLEDGRAKRTRGRDARDGGGVEGGRRLLVVPKPRALGCVTNASAVAVAPVVKKSIPAPRAPPKSVADEDRVAEAAAS